MKSIQKWSVGGLLTAGLVMVGFVAAAGGLRAQNPGIKRTVVYTGDVSVPGREARIASVDIAPGANAGRHTHPGDEITYVIEGEGELLIDGQPPLKFKAGDGFVVKAGMKHDARNTGTRPVKLAAIYVVDKGKPIATPVP
ncbi:MAG TPA: cupin domain-containing protein [Bryobacteraceae bacterium]|jgi:quercetin dioxygenase-like cupin family protein|nr:cupin domain-containing protein [Bryobacteraceae bacterium]